MTRFDGYAWTVQVFENSAYLSRVMKVIKPDLDISAFYTPPPPPPDPEQQDGDDEDDLDDTMVVPDSQLDGSGTAQFGRSSTMSTVFSLSGDAEEGEDMLITQEQELEQVLSEPRPDSDGEGVSVGGHLYQQQQWVSSSQPNCCASSSSSSMRGGKGSSDGSGSVGDDDCLSETSLACHDASSDSSGSSDHNDACPTELGQLTSSTLARAGVSSPGGSSTGSGCEENNAEGDGEGEDSNLSVATVIVRTTSRENLLAGADAGRRRKQLEAASSPVDGCRFLRELFFLSKSLQIEKR